MWTDRQMDTTKPTVAFHSFVNAPNKGTAQYTQVTVTHKIMLVIHNELPLISDFIGRLNHVQTYRHKISTPCETCKSITYLYTSGKSSEWMRPSREAYSELGGSVTPFIPHTSFSVSEFTSSTSQHTVSFIK